MWGNDWSFYKGIQWIWGNVRKFYLYVCCVHGSAQEIQVNPAENWPSVYTQLTGIFWPISFWQYVSSFLPHFCASQKLPFHPLLPPAKFSSLWGTQWQAIPPPQWSLHTHCSAFASWASHTCRTVPALLLPSSLPCDTVTQLSMSSLTLPLSPSLVVLIEQFCVLPRFSGAWAKSSWTIPNSSSVKALFFSRYSAQGSGNVWCFPPFFPQG